MGNSIGRYMVSHHPMFPVSKEHELRLRYLSFRGIQLESVCLGDNTYLILSLWLVCSSLPDLATVPLPAEIFWY